MPSEKYSHACTEYSVLAPFTWITASMQRCMDAISPWHCWGFMEDQDASIAAFSSSALFGLISLIFLLAMSHRFSMGFRSSEFAGQSSTEIWYFWQCGQVPNPAEKWSQHLYKACLLCLWLLCWNFQWRLFSVLNSKTNTFPAPNVNHKLFTSYLSLTEMFNSLVFIALVKVGQ